jgi:predicted RNA methylase
LATKQNTVEEVVKFPKEQLLTAKKYSNRKDVLGVVLEDGKEYSFEEADSLIADFMKGKVK